MFLAILKIVCLEDMNKYFDVLPICYYNSYAVIIFQDILIEHRICKKATIIIIRTVENEELI